MWWRVSAARSSGCASVPSRWRMLAPRDWSFASSRNLVLLGHRCVLIIVRADWFVWDEYMPCRMFVASCNGFPVPVLGAGVGGFDH